MATVDPPEPTYRPQLPANAVADGLLSAAQLEQIVYAGQSHEKTLPAADGETVRRRGYFIGDGTGVGKGREIAGIILDNFEQGRIKAVWVSEKKPLIGDARRDWSGLGQDENLIFDVGKSKAGEPLKAAKGIGFVTYDTLKGGLSDQAALARGSFIRNQKVVANGKPGTVHKVEKRGKDQVVVVKFDDGTDGSLDPGAVTAAEATAIKSRVDQIVDWVGTDFDGVIAFDESHNMGNAITVKGDRGLQEAAQKALAGLALQERLPNARVVYVSATGATEVSNLAYAERLGLWGRGTAFADRNKFISDVESGGIAAMELVARDMKQLGLYAARNLSYDGVEYERLEHKLDATQREIYDTLAEAWQVVLRNINEALEKTHGDKSRNAKAAAYAAFWSTHQRFFNQVVTALQMPSVIDAVEADLVAGRVAVLQLTNTNEASQERAAAKAETAEDIEDLDITPRDALIQLVERSFPTQQYEEFEDPDTGKTGMRPVMDSAGNPVENREAVAMREKLIGMVSSVRVPQGPLDLILDHFGTDVVAEVTGRKRRFVLKDDGKGSRRRMEESRPGSSNVGEVEAFQDGRKRALVFSDAGGTGRSYHADNKAKSKGARRVHYLVQAGWRADKAVQGFGRTHRTNQASAPVFRLATTDLPGQRRFISSVARRLAQLGALTKGQRQAGDQGLFTARDNLESHEAELALEGFFLDLYRGGVEGMSIDEFETQTGLQLRKRDPSTGATLGLKDELPAITQFLNRLLSLKIDAQNLVFNAFAERLDSIIEARRDAGVLDLGLETVTADKIEKTADTVVFTSPDSGAETRHVTLKLSNRYHPFTMEQAEQRKVIAWVKSPKGRVYAMAGASNHTEKGGAIIEQIRLLSPVSGSRVQPRRTIEGPQSKWTKIERADAETLWAAEIAAQPEFVSKDLHLITGAVLPIWDRLKGTPRVVRLETDTGERLLGRVVENAALDVTLKALGAGTGTAKVTPHQLFERIMEGGTARLANRWTLKRSLVGGDHRIELIGPATWSEGEAVKKEGVTSEIISYRTRYFVPVDEDEGPKVLAAVTEFRPVADIADAADPDDDDDGASRVAHMPPRPGQNAAAVRKRLEEAIRASGKSERALSTAIGRGPGYVTQMLKEGKDPGLDAVVALAKELDVSAMKLLFGVDVDASTEELVGLYSGLDAEHRADLLEVLRVMARVAGRTGKRAELLLEKLGNAAPDLDRLRAELLSGPFAKWVGKLLDSGRLVLVRTGADAGIPGAKGVTNLDSGVMYLAADALAPGDAQPTLLHEAFHNGAPALLGQARWNELMGRLAKLYRSFQRGTGRRKEVFDAASRSVYEALQQGAPMAGDMMVEEFGAYAISHYDEMPKTLRDWVDDVIGTVKAWLFRRFGKQVGAVTPAELRALAAAALRATAAPPRRGVAAAMGAMGAVADTPAFKRWFGDSKVVDAAGRPLVVYHGTGVMNDSSTGDFSIFRTDSEMGAHFGTIEQAENRLGVPSQRYPARIFPAYLRIENPLRLKDVGEFSVSSIVSNMRERNIITRLEEKGWMDAVLDTLDEDDAMDESDAGDRLSRDFVRWLQDRGYDGIVYLNRNESAGIDEDVPALEDDGYDKALSRFGLTDDQFRELYPRAADSWVAFEPQQIKSAIANTGAFNPADPRIVAAMPTTPAKKVTRADVTDALAGLLTDKEAVLLKAIPLTYFPELARPNMTAVKEYLKKKRDMDAYRGTRHADADKIAQDWLQYVRAGFGLLPSQKGAAKAVELAQLMHDSTLRGVDPSEPDPEHVTPAYQELRRRYLKLSPDGQALYARVRDAYAAQAKELDKLILENVRRAQEIARTKAEEDYERDLERIEADPDLNPEEKRRATEAATSRFGTTRMRSLWAQKARESALRKAFEKSRVPAPYFPLARFGQYFVTVRDVDGTVLSFSRREKAGDMRRLARDMKEAFPAATVTTGVLDAAGTTMREAMDPRIVTEIQTILQHAGVAHDVMDQIWQRYLQSMPDLSTRKRFIHRKGIAGFDADALRTFAHHMFHAAHQMARLKYGLDLTELVDQVAEQAKKADDVTKAVTLSNQLRRQHEWVMNPLGGQLAQSVTSAMFVWHLAMTPAAALVNLTQTPMLGIPVLGARYGVPKATAALLKAATDTVSGRGSVARSPNLTPEERWALERFNETGLIDRTQAHDLAGVGDTGVTGFTPLKARVMAVISWAFHRAEVWNREVTALAAFRLAKEQGMSPYAAVDEAHDLTWKTHFDYSNASRPQFMQGDTAKTILVFQNFQLNMWYRLLRDLRQSFKGETPAARREARMQLAGIMGMMTLFGGVTGFFGFNVMMGIANLLGGLFGDDDPLDAEAEFRRSVIEMFGPDLGGIILNGVPGHLLGIDLTSRIGMPDFFVRAPDPDLEGRDWWKEFIIGVLGVVPSTVMNIGDGVGLVTDGKTVKGLELMAPKAIKDMMQAYRFANEGVTTRQNDEILPADQLSMWDLMARAVGFTPARIAETYERNSALKDAEQRILDRRRELLNKFAMAHAMGDEEIKDRILADIRAFNAVELHRAVAITSDTIKRSLKTRATNAAKRLDGVLIQNEALGAELRDLLPEALYR
jgi:hypothetical protein